LFVKNPGLTAPRLPFSCRVPTSSESFEEVLEKNPCETLNSLFYLFAA
jgi:hypothetical protein